MSYFREREKISIDFTDSVSQLDILSGFLNKQLTTVTNDLKKMQSRYEQTRIKEYFGEGDELDLQDDLSLSFKSLSINVDESKMTSTDIYLEYLNYFKEYKQLLTWIIKREKENKTYVVTWIATFKINFETFLKKYTIHAKGIQRKKKRSNYSFNKKTLTSETKEFLTYSPMASKIKTMPLGCKVVTDYTIIKQLYEAFEGLLRYVEKTSITIK